jgi:hypothetical protein
VDLFLDHAREILEAAESAARRGEACSPMTILVGRENGIHMIAGSDWPLESLTRHHGAEVGYRVTKRRGTVQVEGRTGSRSCLLQSTSPAETFRLLLGSR